MTPEEAVQQYNDALVDYRDAIRERLLAWRPMKDIESEIIVNGGHGGISIDGKNEMVREAQLRQARNRQPDWVRLDQVVRNAEANKEAALATMEMCKAVLAYEAAAANERGMTVAAAGAQAMAAATASNERAAIALNEGDKE